MKTLILIIIAFISFSCGQPVALTAPSHGNWVIRNTVVDDALLPYMAEYKQELVDRGLSLSRFDMLKDFIFTKDVGQGHWGLCIYSSDELGKFTQIFIAPELKENNVLTRAVAFHEMGHCIQLADHSADPNNLMFFQMNVPYKKLKNEWGKVKDELFQEFQRQNLNLMGDEDEKDISCVLDETRG